MRRREGLGREEEEVEKRMMGEDGRERWEEDRGSEGEEEDEGRRIGKE